MEPPREVPAGRVALGRVVAPGSKSHALRVLVAAALARGTSTVSRVPSADDVAQVLSALAALGFEMDRVGPDIVRVHGRGGVIPATAARLDVGGSATGLRFLAAACALGRGPYEVTGDASLLRRPVGAIVPALRSLGLAVDGRAASGRLTPPLIVSGGPARGVEVEVDASLSSHPLSAMLLVAPFLGPDVVVRARGDVASRPYVDLTVATMRAFGAGVDPTPNAFRVRGGYAPRDLAIEGDWSSASYLLAAAAATGGSVEVEGLDPGSTQADRRFLDLLRAFGADVDLTPSGARVSGRVTRAIQADLGTSPDLAPLIGALACLVPGTTRVTGAPHLRIKETDRIAEVVRCARALGCEARPLADGFEVDGGGAHGAIVDPAGDHRLAMAFAIAGLAVPGTRIADPTCVRKSYPRFWDDLSGLSGRRA